MRRPSAIRHSYQAGASLVELMIAIVIGLLITLLVTGHFLSSRQSYQITTVTSELLDDQRYAMQVITRQLLLAGYSDYWSERDDVFEAATVGEMEFAQGELVKSNALSEVWLRFMPAKLEGQTIQGCRGESFSVNCDGRPVGERDDPIVMRLFVDGAELKCQRADGAGESSAEPLVSHVEAIAFTYLDDSDEFESPPSVNWAEVRAVKVELLLASGSPAFDAPVAQSYVWRGGTKTFNDRKMRSRTSRIVALRNALEEIR